MNLSFPTLPNARIVQPWGNVNFRMYPAPSGRHMGMDIAGVPIGSPIYAVADGVVDLASQVNVHGYGRHIILQHDGFRSLYGHLHKLFVREGQQVHAGDKIGQMGGDPADSDPIDGASTGTHLHFEIILRVQPDGDSIKTWAGFTVDPFPFLLKRYAAPAAYSGKVVSRDGVRVRPEMSASPTVSVLSVLPYLSTCLIVETMMDGADKWAKLWSIRHEWVAVIYGGKTLIELDELKPTPAESPVVVAAAMDEKTIRQDEIDRMIALLQERKGTLCAS